MRVRDDEVGAAVAAVVARSDPHPGVRVGEADARRALHQPEAEPERVGRGATLARDVHVEPVRVGVVRDVEVGTAVAVRVHEHGAETVLGRAAVDARLLTDLPEPGVALGVVAGVEVEQVADALVVVREPCVGRAGGVHVGVARDEDVGPPVAVHVRDGGAGVPAPGGDAGGAGALAEVALAVVPEQGIVAGCGDVDVGRAVAVEVARHAAVAAELDVGSRRAADVGEPPLHVVEEGAAGHAAVLQPVAEVVIRIGVDGEQVEPAVAVDVDPADAAAHHRGHVHRRLRPERVLLEVDPHGRGDVLEARSADAGGDELRRRVGCDRLGRAAARADDDVARPVELELERSGERRRRARERDRRGRAVVGDEPLRARGRRDDDRRILADGGLELELELVDVTLRDDDRARPRGADLRPQPLEPRPTRRPGGARPCRGCGARLPRSGGPTTRSLAICRASVGSICVATPFEGRTVSCGRVSGRSGGPGHGRLGTRGNAGEHEHRGEHGRAGESGGAEPVAARAARTRAAGAVPAHRPPAAPRRRSRARRAARPSSRTPSPAVRSAAPRAGRP